ncbi:MAG TPA: GNAT family N-acetyltransferase [Candidatus Acidoferrales bacterium]|nr:GNAT family N-acetyltransferase [Candidatus Acidoferrales bacterium]
MPIRVVPATPDRWNDVVSVFGRRGDNASWCWCRRFLSPIDRQPVPDDAPPNNRESLRSEIARAGIPPGLIALVDGRPAGWTRVGPRSGFPGVTGNRALARVLTDDPGAWWVTCFAVNAKCRRTGVGSALLHAAVDFARAHGATVVEGHPVDVAGLSAASVSGSAVFTGTVAMFTAAGFTAVAHTHPTRPVMRLSIEGSTRTAIPN